MESKNTPTANTPLLVEVHDRLGYFALGRKEEKADEEDLNQKQQGGEEERLIHSQDLVTALESGLVRKDSLQPIVHDTKNLPSTTRQEDQGTVLLPCSNYGANSRSNKYIEREEEPIITEGDSTSSSQSQLHPPVTYSDTEYLNSDIVYTIPGSPGLPGSLHSRTSLAQVYGFNDWIADLLERWIISIIRRYYTPQFAHIFGIVLTLALIFAILILYFTGNIDILIRLARHLICEIIRQIQGDATEFGFCYAK